MAKTAYAYSRFSSKQQAVGDSIRRQKGRVQDWLRDNPSFAVEFISDQGISAHKGKNRTLGQFGVFLERLRSGELGKSPVLLVENLDRVSREHIEDAQPIFLELINRGATVVTLHNNKSYKKPLSLVDVITALIEMDLAHQESSKKSERIRRAYDALRNKNKTVHTNGNCPSWLRLVDRAAGTWEIVEEQANVVRRIYTLAASGLGEFKIARLLNSERVATFGMGKMWYPKFVEKLIRTRATLGVYVSDSRARVAMEVPGYFPAIIDQELWQRANDRGVRRGATRGKRGTEANLFRGNMWSALDGSRMVHRRGATATPAVRKIYNKISYLRTRLKSTSGVQKQKNARLLDEALEERAAFNESQRENKRVSYSYRYETLVSVATLTGAAKASHRIDYAKVETAILTAIRNLRPDLLRKLRGQAVDAEQIAINAATNRVVSAEKAVKKFTRLLLSDDEPGETLAGLSKNADAELAAAKSALTELERNKKSQADTPRVTPALLESIEGRRQVRTDIARWCSKITLHQKHVVVWFGDQGLGISLESENDLWLVEDKNALDQKETDAQAEFATAKNLPTGAEQ